MARRSTPRNPLFDGRWFEDEIIIWCLRWYFRYKLSYRDLVEMMGERGLPVAHTTILRWAVRYAEEFEKRWRRYERPVGGSWRADETYIKVRGRWVYLYRAVDAKGQSIDFYLSRNRDKNAATAFFRKAMKHHGEPRTITLDGFEPSHSRHASPFSHRSEAFHSAASAQCAEETKVPHVVFARARAAARPEGTEESPH